MQPVRQIGPTVAVGSGATAAITNPSSVVLVANASTTVMAFFSAQATNAAPGAGTGVPIPPLHSVPVSIPQNATYYGANGAALSVTPVEMMRSQ